MARFFIDRPVFAMVIAIVTVIVGAVAIPNLPIATYPQVVPPVVQIIAVYRGGNSQDLEKTVAQPIEQRLVGLDGMLYFFSRASNDGTLTIDVTYELGTDIDLATVKTQNKVSLAMPSLPPEVQREGVTVKKVSSTFLMAIALFSSDDRYDSLFLNNYATINLLDQIGSIPGVGDDRLVAPQDYGMRIWINPDKMGKLGLTATDVNNAIQAQNRQNHAGAIGQPPVRAAISDVVLTLFAAVLLVIIVVFIFLQNWRATLIPLLTVPVAIVGTFALFPFLGFSINMTSMFGLVLAIGIVVDDAIVVVEAVQHNIDRGMSARDATVRAMSEVSGPVIAIAFILAAVFIPVALIGGISGQIYRQF